MRASLQALAVSGALIVAAVAPPAMGQGAPAADSSAPAAGEPATNAAAPPAAAPPAAADSGEPVFHVTAIATADIKKAVSQIRSASRNYVQCDRASQCSAYFESFGVALTFADGTMAPFAHEQRLKQSGHDCIQNAREALLRGDRALAVQWVMAAHMDDPLIRNWLGDHPDAVLEALRRFAG